MRLQNLVSNMNYQVGITKNYRNKKVKLHDRRRIVEEKSSSTLFLAGKIHKTSHQL